MSGRFASLELLSLGRPPALAAKSHDLLFQEAMAVYQAKMLEAGLPYDVSMIKSDSGVKIINAIAVRDGLRLQEIDDTVAQSFLGSATDAMLDHRAADYGVVRRVVQLADPLLDLPLIMEDDDSLRLRARLAWEALSVAGPAGAYVFHTLDAHPGVFDAIAYGPESGLVPPGEVLDVVQSRTDDGVPTDAMLDVIAARLDAYSIVYGNGSSILRTVRDPQSVRPLGAMVTVVGAQPLVYTTTATLYITAYGDAEALRVQALAQLVAYQERCRRIGRRVSREGRQAALSLVGTDGLPVIDEVVVVEDDVVPSHLQIPVPGAITLTMVVR